MPRPGPRPYECVRRAWHSERHQPMRGSLIREIFRVVDEIHSPATKKNKEWQEKLPLVVLKSEEIMYSKANSEAEYMDLKTLWERTNDAINTIIRRDESTETGELLPPCIEAALNLGCTARRTSRSQRNSNPRCYLTPSNQDENFTQGSYTVNSQGITHYSTFMKSVNTDTSQNSAVQHNNGSTNKFPFASYSNKLLSPTENYSSPNSFSVYPLYYGTCLKSEEQLRGFESLGNSTSNYVEPVKINFVQNSLGLNSSIMAAQTYVMGIPEIPRDIGCDLSLRLGPLSVTGPSVEYNQPQLVKDVGSSSLEGNKLSDLAPQMKKQLYYFSKANVEDPLDICSSQWGVDGNVDTKLRKRKAHSVHPLEDQHFHWQSKLPYTS